MEIIISNSNGVAIYEQICEQIKNKILSCELKENELLPSIRALARDLHCSVITTKKAYEELEKEGFVVMVPGKGVYVAQINREFALEEEKRKIEELMEKIIFIAKNNNIEKKELQQMWEILSEEAK